jgi:glycoprotein endo-alpha-1,2-mannosidase
LAGCTHFIAANGEYYRRFWERAIAERADMVSITSYNEWGEGTQIESAVARAGGGSGDDAYSDYEAEGGPDAYICHREDACARDRLSGEQAAARRRRGGWRRPET